MEIVLTGIFLGLFAALGIVRYTNKLITPMPRARQNRRRTTR